MNEQELTADIISNGLPYQIIDLTKITGLVRKTVTYDPNTRSMFTIEIACIRSGLIVKYGGNIITYFTEDGENYVKTCISCMGYSPDQNRYRGGESTISMVAIP